MATTTTRGRFFEDFTVGDIYRCRYGRTISEADNITFSLLTNNTNQIHFNREYGAKSVFGRCLVNSTLTLSIVTGMGVEDISEHGIAIGWEDVRLPHPLFPGDTVYTESEVIETRESKSRPGQGIVRVRTWGYNQDGACVIRFERSVLIWRQDHAPTSFFPEPDLDAPR